jgi:hypothetical protein
MRSRRRYERVAWKVLSASAGHPNIGENWRYAINYPMNDI